MVSESSLHITWRVKPSFEQGTKSFLCRGPSDGGYKRVPLRRNFRVRWQAVEVH
jgi:hypothetical protein